MGLGACLVNFHLLLFPLVDQRALFLLASLEELLIVGHQVSGVFRALLRGLGIHLFNRLVGLLFLLLGLFCLGYRCLEFLVGLLDAIVLFLTILRALLFSPLVLLGVQRCLRLILIQILYCILSLLL